MTLGDRPIRFPDIHFTRYHTASAGHASSHHCLHAPRAPSPRTAPPPPPTTPPDTRHTCTADFHGRVLPRRRHLPRARPAQVLRTAPRAAAGPAQLPCRSGPPAATVSYPPLVEGQGAGALPAFGSRRSPFGGRHTPHIQNTRWRRRSCRAAAAPQPMRLTPESRPPRRAGLAGPGRAGRNDTVQEARGLCGGGGGTVEETGVGLGVGGRLGLCGCWGGIQVA